MMRDDLESLRHCRSDSIQTQTLISLLQSVFRDVTSIPSLISSHKDADVRISNALLRLGHMTTEDSLMHFKIKDPIRKEAG